MAVQSKLIKTLEEHATVEHVIGEIGHRLSAERKDALMRWKVGKLVRSTDAQLSGKNSSGNAAAAADDDPLENN